MSTTPTPMSAARFRRLMSSAATKKAQRERVEIEALVRLAALLALARHPDA
jgi:hypothetical protein